MKPIDSKYLFILFGALLVLFLSFAYMSYGVVVGRPAPKSPAEVIDSLNTELANKEKEILMLRQKLSTSSGVKENEGPRSTPLQRTADIRSEKNRKANAPARFEGF